MNPIFNYIQNFDDWLLLLVNKTWTNSFFDFFFPFITDLNRTIIYKVGAPLLLFSTLWYFQKKKGLFYFFIIITTLMLNDFLCNNLIKKQFERPRPMHTNLDVIVRTEFFGGFSFVSNHAANIFCSMTFLALLFPKARLYFFIVAFLVAYSRMYVGVHYFTDILGGAIVGSLFAFFTYSVSNKILNKRFQNV